MIHKELSLFFAALRFFTRVPVPAWVGHSAKELHGAARYFPVVGMLVGALGAIVTLVAARLWPAEIAVLLGIAATLLFTGAFHEDGLADAADGLGGGMTREAALAIMKDSRLGSFGALALIVVLGLKYFALRELLASLAAATFCAALVAAHAVSRLAAVFLIRAFAYVREETTSRAKPLATQLSRGALAFAVGSSLLPLFFLPFSLVAPAIIGAVAITALFARYLVVRLGGYTGDCLGAAQQLAEVSFYLGLLCACG